MNKLKKLSNGDIEGIVEFPEQKVEVGFNGETHIIGNQPPYKVLNIIKRENVAKLKLYLEEQYNAINKKYIAAQEAMKPFKDMEAVADKFDQSLKLIPKDTTDDRKYTNRLDKTNELANKIIMYLNARANSGILKTNLDNIQNQLDFIKENY